MAGEDRFRPARLVGRDPAGGGLVRVVVEPAPELLSTYATPGQYVEMRAGDGTGFFVLSSDPGASSWQLVMRSGGGASDVVLTLPPGAPIGLTGALGHGFPMQEARGRPLLLAVNGTGVAAGPPVVHRRVLERDAARTRVFVGVRVRSELPLESELRAWVAAGIDLTVCLSQDEPGAQGAGPELSGLRFARGYVQDVVREEARGWAAGGHVFAVGASPMIDALRALSPSLGVAPDRVLSNY